jgi:hypothetical protein
MAMSEKRNVVAVTLAQKQAIVKAARRLGLSDRELMREAALGFVQTEDPQRLDALVERVHACARKASTAVDDMISFVESSNERIASMTPGN